MQTIKAANTVQFTSGDDLALTINLISFVQVWSERKDMACSAPSDMESLSVPHPRNPGFSNVWDLIMLT